MSTIALLPDMTTPRLVLREIENRHKQGFTQFMLQPDYQKYTTARLRDDEDINGFVARAISSQTHNKRHIFHLAAEEQLSQEAIGYGFIIYAEEGFYEIGWGLHPAMWQMGLGCEIGEALLSLCFERLKAPGVWCKVMRNNKASWRLALHIGMKAQGRIGSIALDRERIEPVEKFTMTQAQYFNKPY